MQSAVNYDNSGIDRYPIVPAIESFEDKNRRENTFNLLATHLKTHFRNSTKLF